MLIVLNIFLKREITSMCLYNIPLLCYSLIQNEYVTLKVSLFNSVLSLDIRQQNTSYGRFVHYKFLKPHYTNHKLCMLTLSGEDDALQLQNFLCYCKMMEIVSNYPLFLHINIHLILTYQYSLLIVSKSLAI